jgi:phage gp16-like protein
MTNSIAAIHVAKKQLGLDEDTYRAKLANITGKTSAKDMTEDQRQAVLVVFRNEGFVPAANAKGATGRTKLAGKYAKKLQALWIAGWNLGIIHDRDDKALTAFVEGRTGIQSVRWLHHHDDADRAIGALKAWLARDGGVIWSHDDLAPHFKRAYGYKIARAQFRIMLPGVPENDLWFIVSEITNKIDGTREISDREWILVMNDFGERIRAGKAV